MARVSPKHFASTVAGGHLRFFGCRPYHKVSLVERLADKLRRPSRDDR
jgi:hypothetical protein